MTQVPTLARMLVFMVGSSGVLVLPSGDHARFVPVPQRGRFSELFVIARNSSFRYKGKAVDIRQIGRELGVAYVLEGSIRRQGDRVRIAAQLVNALTATHHWAERYDRQL